MLTTLYMSVKCNEQLNLLEGLLSSKVKSVWADIAQRLNTISPTNGPDTAPIKLPAIILSRHLPVIPLLSNHLYLKLRAQPNP